MIRLALDHITVTDTTPSQLASVARAVGCDGICLFMEPMAVLPRMPHFELIGDTAERRELKARCTDLGVSIDVAYPFTLAGRTEVQNFAAAMETAAWLNVKAVNALVYDRDPARRADKFAAFCAMAKDYGLDVVVEFFPVSQIRSLTEAVDLVRQIGRPGAVGVNVDLLHLMRSGGSLADLRAAPPEYIGYGQLCDGPAECDSEKRDWEASSQRLLAGEGAFDIAGFAAVLPANVPISVELPQEAAIIQGVPVEDRARRAVDGVRRIIEAAIQCGSIDTK